MKTDKLLSNHALVLLYVAQHPTATYRQISRALDLSEAHTGQIARDLVHDGLLLAERNHNHMRYRVNPDAHFRHPMLAQVPVAHFTEVVASQPVVTSVV